ncbi:hypothetical protein ABNX05_12255 [Lysinibacillus sp. M3]|uniref:Uncharacterized protein n=1 Tax=Lysinibacillus zambalensis TaxID=3160866 RepID=A0ABV1MUX0_9BACI
MILKNSLEIILYGNLPMSGIDFRSDKMLIGATDVFCAKAKCNVAADVFGMKAKHSSTCKLKTTKKVLCKKDFS